MPDQEPVEASPEAVVPGATRRGMLRGAAGIGAAGLAASVLAGAAVPADAAVRASKADDAAPSKTLTVYIADTGSGVLDVFNGTSHVRLIDRQIAARLAQAAR